MKTFVASDWEAILRFNQLDTFEQLWELEAGWFEPPNKRRGGWSGASRYELKDPDGGVKPVFIKRQENHLGKTWRHPINGEPSFAIEMRNIMRLCKIQVPALTPVYYAQRIESGNVQAILMTQELTGFVPLTDLLLQWGERDWPRHQARPLTRTIAAVLARMHQHRLQHHGMYTKHIFVQLPENGEPKVHLIDLEKMRFNWFPWLAMRRDLYTLFKEFGPSRCTDQMRFLLAYLGETRLTSRAKRIWRAIHRKTKQKHPRKF